MVAIEVLDIALAQIPHQRRTTTILTWSDEKMHMIRHQAISMNRDLKLLCELTQVHQIDKVVAAFPEASIAVIATLDDMRRDSGNDEARLTRHGTINEKVRQALTKPGSDPGFCQ